MNQIFERVPLLLLLVAATAVNTNAMENNQQTPENQIGPLGLHTPQLNTRRRLFQTPTHNRPPQQLNKSPEQCSICIRTPNSQEQVGRYHFFDCRHNLHTPCARKWIDEGSKNKIEQWIYRSPTKALQTIKWLNVFDHVAIDDLDSAITNHFDDEYDGDSNPVPAWIEKHLSNQHVRLITDFAPNLKSNCPMCRATALQNPRKKRRLPPKKLNFDDVKQENDVISLLNPDGDILTSFLCLQER